MHCALNPMVHAYTNHHTLSWSRGSIFLFFKTISWFSKQIGDVLTGMSHKPTVSVYSVQVGSVSHKLARIFEIARIRLFYETCALVA